MTQDNIGAQPDATHNDQDRAQMVDGMHPVYPGDSDLMLQILLGMVHDDEAMEFGITLTVGGTLISGLLVSRRRCLQFVMDNYPDAKFTMQPFLDHFESEEAQQAEQEASGQRYFVNLIQSQTIVGENFIPGNAKGSWRGRVSSVDGWSLGQINHYDD